MRKRNNTKVDEGEKSSRELPEETIMQKYKQNKRSLFFQG